MKLTGATRFRSNWRGKLVLQVQYQQHANVCGKPDKHHVVIGWRDARTEDLAELHALHYTNINVLLPEANAVGEVVDGRTRH
jgi:hypothetical protein